MWSKFLFFGNPNRTSVALDLYFPNFTRRFSGFLQSPTLIGSILFLDLNWKKHQRENDDGYSSIDDISVSTNARKSLAMNPHENRLSVTCSTPITKQSEATSRLRQDTRNEIFEMQKIGFQNSGFDWHESDLDGPDSDISRTFSDTSNILDGNVDVNPIYEDTEVMLNGKGDAEDYSEPEYVAYEP